MEIIRAFVAWVRSLFTAPEIIVEDHEIISFDPRPPEPLPPVPVPPTVPENEELKWGTAKEAYHSVRVLCDEAGLSLAQKNLICACIYQESGFLNYRAPGVPTKFENKEDSKVWSTDWGICQINDTKGWHIGPGLPFPTVGYVLDHPEKAVAYMIKMLRMGKLFLWSSYKFGDYKQWLVPSSPMWKLKS